MSTPYSHLTDEQLIQAINDLESEIDSHVLQLDWSIENDPDTGLIDAFRGDLDHMVADYNWMLNEMTVRGLKR